MFVRALQSACFNFYAFWKGAPVQSSDLHLFLEYIYEEWDVHDIFTINFKWQIVIGCYY